MQKSIIYIASTLDEVYKTAYSVLKFLDVYNLKPPGDIAVVIYTNHPELLEAYGSFFSNFELRPIQPVKMRAEIIKEAQLQSGDNATIIDAHQYPIADAENPFLTGATSDEDHFSSHQSLKEFGTLLKDFFGRYQEESVPNQVKLIHNIDPVKIREEKKAFQGLPLPAKWLRKLIGKGWNIKNYQVRI